MTNNKCKTASSSKSTKKTEINNKETNNTFLYVVIVIVLIAGIIGFLVYYNKKNKEDESYKTSYLITSGTIKNEIKGINDVNRVLNNDQSQFFVLITYNKNKETHKLETGLKEIIDKYNFSNKFYYFNVGDMIEDDNYIAKLNTAFNTNKIEKVPIILYYEDNELIDVVKRIDNNVINASDFQHLLDIYLDL